VSRNVHESERKLAASEKCKAEVYGDTAPAFFLEAIRMRTRQRFHQGGFAVINVPGGADDDVFHGV